MDRFKHKVPDEAKADSSGRSSRVGRLLFFGGLAVTASAVLVGFLIEEELQASGMHRMTGPDANPNPGLALLFGFGFPAGLFLAALGGILQGPSTPRTALLFSTFGVFVVLSAGWLPGVLGRAPDAAYFGAGGVTILLCVSLVFWHWLRLRCIVPRAVIPALDLFGSALFCFAVAAWNLCGAAAMPSFLLEPEKVIEIGTLAFAIGQMKTVMGLIVVGWVLVVISLGLAFRVVSRATPE